MIVRDPLRGEPNINITFGSDLPIESLYRAVLHMGEGLHDVLDLYISGGKPQRLSAYNEMPILMEWGNSKMSVFAGYITEVRPMYHANVDTVNRMNPEVRSPISNMMVRCFGASSRMRVPGSRSWVNRTVPSVVREILARYRFSTDVEDHSYVWPAIVQSGCNDWEFLRQLAGMIGYRFTCNATHARFYDPAGVVQRPHIIPTVSTQKTGAKSGPSIKEFAPSFGGVTGTGFSGVLNLDGFDSSTGATFSLRQERSKPILGSSVPSVRSERHVDSNAGTLGQARVELGAAYRENLWPISADMTCSGSTDILPGNLLRVSGFNAEYDGLWYVLDVEHNMERGKFESRATLGKDAIGEITTPLPNLIVHPPPPPMIISNEWVTSRAA